MDQRPKDTEVIERQIDLSLVEMARLYDQIWDGMEILRDSGRLQPGLEDHVCQVMSEVSYWADQCTARTEATPVLLRRIEIHLNRLSRTRDLVWSQGIREGEGYR